MAKQRKIRLPRRTPTLEPAPPLKIEISEKEILADLIYPASRLNDSSSR
jgi:hypothetical protein